MTDNRGSEELQFPVEVQDLLHRYRASTPDFEGSPNFVPGLWNKIEARRRTTYSFGRLAKMFVTAAAAICLVFSAALIEQQDNTQAMMAQPSYVDVLAEEAADDLELVAARLENL